jgi:hypothetical protein
MTPHVDDGLLQDFREGLLSPEVEEEVRKHLAACSRCRGELEALAKLMDDLAALPQEAQPARDLWPQIAWRMAREGKGAGEVGPRVDPAAAGESLPVRAGRGVGRGRGWRVNLAAWQLLAASLVVALISGASVWAFLTGRGEGTEPMAGPPQWTAQQVGWVDAYEGFDEAVADLEAALEQGRHVLDPETIRVLEESLAIIDKAIHDARGALDQDPGSPVVRRILAENLRLKVSLLRHAVSAVYTNT